MSDHVLVGDIGGTNVRFAKARLGFAGHPEISDVAIMPGDDFPDFTSALSLYLKDLGNARPDQALFAFAGPVQDGVVRLTNRDWTVDRRELQRKLGFERVRIVNDYAAMARSIPELPDTCFRVLNPGRVPDERRPILVAGPGTGLGVATLLPVGPHDWRVITGEGGHTAYAPRTPREWALASHLKKRHGYVSNELILSGVGLDEVHRALCEIDGVEWVEMPPAKIMADALAGDRIARDICEIRAAGTLGALGDFALVNGALGGVVVTGGVAERLADWFDTPQALERFFDRGPRANYMQPIPLRILLSGEAALIGAAALYFDEESEP